MYDQHGCSAVCEFPRARRIRTLRRLPRRALRRSGSQKRLVPPSHLKGPPRTGKIPGRLGAGFGVGLVELSLSLGRGGGGAGGSVLSPPQYPNTMREVFLLFVKCRLGTAPETPGELGATGGYLPSKCAALLSLLHGTERNTKGTSRRLRAHLTSHTYLCLSRFVPPLHRPFTAPEVQR